MKQMVFFPKLEILPSSQRRLWDELRQVPASFTLYGGTAVALHLGHRQSVDFDFFGREPFDPQALYQAVPFLRDALILQQAANTLTCRVERGEPVKISFFGLPQLRAVRPPQITENGIQIASLIDVAGTKAAVVQQRAEAKDYIDLDAIMRHGIGLPMALAAARNIYGGGFNPQITLKALCYFGEGDLAALPKEVKDRLVSAVAEVDLSHLPTLEA